VSNAIALDAPAPGLSQVERVVDVFIAPSQTFKDILRSANCVVPIVLMILFTIASAFVVDRQVGFDRVYENQMRLSPKAAERMDQVPPERKATVVASAINGYKYTAYGFSVILLISMAIYSLLLWASFNFGLGAQTTFPQVFAVSMYASLPYLLTTILVIITLYFGGNADAYDFKNPVGTNLAYFMPDASPIVRGLLVSFDVIKLWSVVLQVIGMAIIAKKSITQSAVIVGIFWIIGVLFGVVGAAFS